MNTGKDKSAPDTLNILWLTTKPPYPLIDGGRIAVYEPLRRLAARGHRITLLTFRLPEQNVAELAPLTEFCRLESLPHDTRTRPLAMVRNLFSPLPYTVAKYQSPLMAQKLAELLARETFDLVHLEQLHMSGYQAISKGKWGIPTLLRQENIESHLVERYWRAQTGVRRLYGRLLAARMRRYEAEQCTAVDGCLAITAEDAQRLRGLSPEVNVVVVPAGVDSERLQPAFDKELPHTLVFVGSMDWLPNADAVLWFHREVLPLVRGECPEVQFYVVGKNPPLAVQQLAEPGTVHVTGFVADVEEYMAQTAVFVIPLRVGGGMRVKLLQALALARAVVSTSIGAEGMAVTHGQDILLADNAAEFASCVVQLLRDPEMRMRLGENGRKLIETSYSWETATDSLESAYRHAIQSKTG